MSTNNEQTTVGAKDLAKKKIRKGPATGDKEKAAEKKE